MFYFVINSTSRLQLAIAESQSKLEKHSMEVHLENRIALGLFGERDGEVTYASYAGMTPSSGSKARGDAHRRGDSGAPRLNAATTGACGKYFAMCQVQVAAPTTVEDAEWIAPPRVRSTARDRARPAPPRRRRFWATRSSSGAAADSTTRTAGAGATSSATAPGS